jgi:hypothetical protein
MFTLVLGCLGDIQPVFALSLFGAIFFICSNLTIFPSACLLLFGKQVGGPIFSYMMISMAFSAFVVYFAYVYLTPVLGYRWLLLTFGLLSLASLVLLYPLNMNAQWPLGKVQVESSVRSGQTPKSSEGSPQRRYELVICK